MERWREEQKRQDLRFGILAAALTGTAKHPRKASDFFKSLTPKPLDSDEQRHVGMQLLGYKGKPPKLRTKPKKKAQD